MKKISIASALLITVLSMISMACFFLLFQNREYRIEIEELAAENDSLLRVNTALIRQVDSSSRHGFFSAVR